MTGFVNRFKRITLSRINAFLETVEEPETVLPQLVREMRSRIEDVSRAESKATAAFRTNQRRLDESTGRSIRLEKGAEMALRHGDESLAREALAEQVRTERLCQELHHALKQSETALVETRELRLHLQVQLEEIKRHKNEIIARSRSVKNTAGTYRNTGRIRAAGAAILDEVSRMEEKESGGGFLTASPGRLPEPRRRSLEDRLRALEQEAEIERRLHSIRERKQSKTDAPRP